MKFALALTSSLLTALALTSAANADSYTDLIGKSARAIVAENWRAGLSAARDVLDMPNLTAVQRAEALTHLCIHLTQIGRAGDAVRACDESIALNGSDWGAYVNRGNAHAANGNRIAATSDYRKAKDLNPAAAVTDIAESMKRETPFAFGRPSETTDPQQAQGEQRLAE